VGGTTGGAEADGVGLGVLPGEGDAPGEGEALGEDCPATGALGAASFEPPLPPHPTNVNVNITINAAQRLRTKPVFMTSPFLDLFQSNCAVAVTFTDLRDT
jgi:hypothetical protein